MIEKSKKLSDLAFKFGALGSLGLIIGIMLSVMGFEDVEGHGFNFLNHTFSELGHYGHSTFAVVVNGGLFFGSLSLILFCLFAIQLADNKLLYPLLLSLTFTFITLAAAGLFPVNVYHLHTAALKYFFYSGAISAFLYLINIFMKGQLLYSRWNILMALMTLISFISFLLLSHKSFGLTPGDRPFYQEMVMTLPRPEIWWPATLEWLSIGIFMLWTIGLVRSMKT
ncbi:DUF998 domain-containing protein [Shewanella eurypsychrophilus]|uniref:DUF998 domain-containing protein n=1 Tax=Shewanella eurypsychrophilus TaxID=2593656 RepID=A0ABX6VBD2_9GAMM|nr:MULTISPECIES: DUF998 domain-containing protein [Shewanella]QFU23916.1 DUF998 domain-containing protein [Shewanella sp. YLB-09]QPG59134.1 DUF998 domain-containing protein [Shewanella eurypsychrophilus]